MNKVQHSANEDCIPHILGKTDYYFRKNNKLCAAYSLLPDVKICSIKDVKATSKEIPVVNPVFKRDRPSDQLCYNVPNQNEIDVVFVKNFEEPLFEYDT